MSDTDEHTPIERSRTRAQERHAIYVRLAKVVVGPLMAALVSIAVAYIQRSDDRADGAKKDEVIYETGKKTTEDMVEELNKLKDQLATVATAAKAGTKLAVEVHEDAPRARGKKRPHVDPDLIAKAKSSVTSLGEVEKKAKEPVAVSVPPERIPEKAPNPDAGRKENAQ